MIVRIMGEGQFELDDSSRAELHSLDEALIASIDAGDAASYQRDVAEAFALVRSRGSALAPGRLVPSDIVLPPSDATVLEVRSLLAAHRLQHD